MNYSYFESKDLVARKIRTLFLIRMSMCGEIDSLRAQDKIPGSWQVVRREIRAMIADKVFSYHMYKKEKHRSLRLSAPKGYEEIRVMSPELFEHLEVLVGTTRRYSGSREYRSKKFKEAKLLSAFLDAEYTVDGVHLENHGEFKQLSTSLTNPVEIIRTAELGLRPLYMSGAIARRKLGENQFHERTEISCFSGVVISTAGILPIYLAQSSKMRWHTTAETQTYALLRNMRIKALDLATDNSDMRYKALFLADKMSVLCDIMNATGRNNTHSDITRTFQFCYAVPMSEEKHYTDIARMLSIPDWKRKSNKILGMSETNHADGVTEDGRPIYNLLCGNLSKQHQIRYELEKGTCAVIVHDWQKEAIEKAWNITIDGMVLTEKHFKGLVRMVEET